MAQNSMALRMRRKDMKPSNDKVCMAESGMRMSKGMKTECLANEMGLMSDGKMGKTKRISRQ